MSDDYSHQIYEYVVCSLDDDGELSDVLLRSEVLAADLADARLRVGHRLGIGKLNPDEVAVFVRPFC